MRPRRIGGRRAAGVCLTVIVLLAPGCGRDNDPSYGERVTTVVQRHTAAIERHQATARAAAAADPAASAAGLQALARELEVLADDVEAVAAPSDREAAASRLIDAYRLLARAALELRAALLAGDVEAAQAAQRDYAAAAEAERQAAAALGAD